MNQGRDPRVTKTEFSVSRFFYIFLGICLLCGVNIGLCFLLSSQLGNDDSLNFSTTQIILVMLVEMLFTSGLLTLILSQYYKRKIQQPILQLCDAARKVAEGDFSLSLEETSTPDKRGEIDVLRADFNTMVAELSSTEMLKKDFISNVSHELKTPIAVIQNYAMLLQSEEIHSSEQREYAQTIAEASKRLSLLVGNILQLSRLENQKISAQVKRYNLSEQLSRCILGFEQIWEEKDIELELELDEDIEVESDEGLLDIVWNNLISNALKFTKQGGMLRVQTTKQGNYVEVLIEDSGCGMSENTLRHIFDKFYQADSSHATLGNGLGLAMVKEILELLHGEIRVESQLGAGSRFFVKIFRI